MVYRHLTFDVPDTGALSARKGSRARQSWWITWATVLSTTTRRTRSERQVEVLGQLSPVPAAQRRASHLPPPLPHHRLQQVSTATSCLSCHQGTVKIRNPSSSYNLISVLHTFRYREADTPSILYFCLKWWI